MKTFNQLTPVQQENLHSFNAIHFDLHNFNSWVNNPNLPHKEIHNELTEFLTKIYKHYENKDTENSKANLENS